MRGGIYYHDGVYVVNDEQRKHESLIYNYYLTESNILYGGRVVLKKPFCRHCFDDVIFIVDGITIVKLHADFKQIIKELDILMVAQYLNAIEVNGVDAFLKNYKESLEILQTDLNKLKEEAQTQLSTLSDDILIEKVGQEIDKIKQLLFYLIGVLFSLRAFISAGLENEKVISVYQSVLELIS